MSKNCKKCKEIIKKHKNGCLIHECINYHQYHICNDDEMRKIYYEEDLKEHCCNLCNLKQECNCIDTISIRCKHCKHKMKNNKHSICSECRSILNGLGLSGVITLIESLDSNPVYRPW